MSPGKYAVRFLPVAEDDLNEIVTFIALDDPTAAESFVDKLESRLEQLGRFPDRGPSPRDERLKAMGYRYLVIGDYLVFYTVEPKTVLVHRVLHGARDYEGLL